VKMSGDGLACLDEGRVATERLDGSHCLRRVWYRGHSWWWCTLHEFLCVNTDTACATMSVPASIGVGQMTIAVDASRRASFRDNLLVANTIQLNEIRKLMPLCLKPA
jgi:hypothetical protein